jgi:FkbM family methyltransferase
LFGLRERLQLLALPKKQLAICSSSRIEGGHRMGYRFRTELRCPMQLEAFSVLSRIIRHAAYALDAPPAQPSLWSIHHDLQSSLRMEHPEWIYKDRLHVRMADRGAMVVVDMRNSQFIGADRTISAFSLGFEPDIAVAIETWVPDDGVLIDVGANWGYFAIYLAARPGFKGKVLAIEPFPSSCKTLETVVSGTGLGHLIEPVSIAAGDKDGFVYMSDEIFSGNNRITAEGGTIRVRQTTIDALVEERGLTRVDFIKIDVEGAEPDVISGARTTISRHRPAIMFENWLGSDTTTGRMAFDLLKSIGPYDFFVVDVDLPTPDALRDMITARAPKAGDIVRCQGTICEIIPEHRDRWPERINVLAAPAGSDFIARLKARDI